MDALEMNRLGMNQSSTSKWGHCHLADVLVFLISCSVYVLHIFLGISYWMGSMIGTTEACCEGTSSCGFSHMQGSDGISGAAGIIHDEILPGFGSNWQTHQPALGILLEGTVLVRYSNCFNGFQ